jgi:hypothetical protein
MATKIVGDSVRHISELPRIMLRKVCRYVWVSNSLMSFNNILKHSHQQSFFLQFFFFKRRTPDVKEVKPRLTGQEMGTAVFTQKISEK